MEGRDRRLFVAATLSGAAVLVLALFGGGLLLGWELLPDPAVAPAISVQPNSVTTPFATAVPRETASEPPASATTQASTTPIPPTVAVPEVVCPVGKVYILYSSAQRTDYPNGSQI